MTTELAPLAPDPAPPPAVARPDLLAAFLSGRKPTTVKAYASDLAHFARLLHRGGTGPALEWVLSLPAGDANALALAYRNTMLADGLASATIARRLAALRSFVKLARTLGRVAWSIEVEAPRPEPRRDVRGPDRSDQKKLWRELESKDDARGRRDRAIIALLFDLALRRGEVAALDLADLDFKGKTIAVLGKGKREKVTLSLKPPTIKALEAWVFARGSDPGPLFIRTDRPASKDRLTGESIARLVARHGKAAKVSRKVRPHGLRHAAITAALEGGLTVREVRAFSRHAKIETVMKYDDARDDPADRVAEFVSKSRK